MTQKLVVVLLSGYSRSGKDEAAKHLRMYGFRHLSFAEALKKEVSSIYKVPYHKTLTQEGKASTFGEGTTTTVRDLLIKHGREMRDVDADYWANKTHQDIIQDNVNKKFVISDTRYMNEIRVMERNELFHVKTLRIDRYDKSPVDDPSETQLDLYPFDDTIQNKGTLEEFEAAIDDYIWKWPFDDIPC